MAVPITDADLAQYSTNFNTRGVAAPADFSLTALQMTAYTALHTPWIDAYNAIAEGGRSPALVAAKNQAKADLLPYARQLYTAIQSNPNVTDENKTLMGVTIRKTNPTPTPPPAQAPMLTIMSVVGRVVKYKLADATAPTKRHRPLNAAGAMIFSFAGATPPPLGSSGWTVEGSTGKNIFAVQFADDVAPGTPCWVTCLWYSRRGAYSPPCEPISTYLQIGPMAEAA